MAGTRPGGPIAAGWAVPTTSAGTATCAWPPTPPAATTLLGAIRSTRPGCAWSADATVFAFGGDRRAGAIDAFALGDALADRGGWYSRPPDTTGQPPRHRARGHAAVVDELCVRPGLGGRRTDGHRRPGRGRDTTYGTV